eukprot:3431345-Pleurochrysis_carterae.AAC.4
MRYSPTSACGLNSMRAKYEPEGGHTSSAALAAPRLQAESSGSTVTAAPTSSMPCGVLDDIPVCSCCTSRALRASVLGSVCVSSAPAWQHVLFEFFCCLQAKDMARADMCCCQRPLRCKQKKGGRAATRTTCT